MITSYSTHNHRDSGGPGGSLQREGAAAMSLRSQLESGVAQGPRLPATSLVDDQGVLTMALGNRISA